MTVFVEPECFGQVNVCRGSPCYRCRLIGPCALRLTEVEPLGLLVFPRLPQPDPIAQDARPSPTMVDPAVAEVMNNRFVAAGLHTHGKLTWWWVGMRYSKGARQVFRVVEALPASRTIEFRDIPPGRLSSLRSARRGISIRPSAGPLPPLPRNPSPQQILARRDCALGSLATAATLDPLVELVAEVVRTLYSDQ